MRVGLASKQETKSFFLLRVNKWGKTNKSELNASKRKEESQGKRTEVKEEKEGEKEEKEEEEEREEEEEEEEKEEMRIKKFLLHGKKSSQV